MCPIESNANLNDSFELYDLKIEVYQDKRRPMICNHPVGAYFLLSGEDLMIPAGGSFPLYSLAAILPLLPAKQRGTHRYDWMSTDSDVACPDPNCGGIFRIQRTRKQKFYHHQVTAVPLVSKSGGTSRREVPKKERV